MPPPARFPQEAVGAPPQAEVPAEQVIVITNETKEIRIPPVRKKP
jgi:hypothetical protein